MKDVKISVESGVNSLTILEGKALEPKDPRKVEISGNIDCPVAYLSKRVSILKILACNLVIDRDNLSLTLTVDESNHFASVIQGSLVLSMELKTLQINSGKRMTAFDMAELIRMNRTCFESKEAAMKLVNDLRKFKAKIDKQVEQSDDKRGNTTLLRTQAVESNLPASFVLNIPIFKGFKPEKIEVEVDIDPTTLECSLVSPMANDIIKEKANGLIDHQESAIRGIAPDLVIFEV